MTHRVNLTKLTAWLSFLAREAREEARHHATTSDARHELTRASIQLGYAVRTVTRDPEASHAVGAGACSVIAHHAAMRGLNTQEAGHA